MIRLLLVFVVFVSSFGSVFGEGIRPVRLAVSNSTLGLGDVLKVECFTIKPIQKAQLLFNGKSFKFFLKPKVPYQRYHYVAYIAASRKSKPGNKWLKVDVALENGDRFSRKKRILLKYPALKKGKVKLSKKKNKLSSNQVQLRKEARIISKGFRKKSTNHWMRQSFIRPAKGRISSTFGALRRYNGTYSRSHAGVDIANKVGTRVVASNDGKVVVSRFLKIHGHTVMIDHGFGVVTIYNHLQERFVQPGQRIRRGELVGRMGQTGVATGPHLHWGMSVQNVRVDPLKFKL